MSVPIGPGTRVTLTFSLSLETGELIDEITEPATLNIGDGVMLPGFEAAMFGMQAGDAGSIDIPAEHAFGDVNPDNIHILPTSSFRDIELTEGLVVSFADNEGQERPGVVSRLFGDRVEIDFNHPLAGKTVRFRAEILAVEQVSDEILRTS